MSSNFKLKQKSVERFDGESNRINLDFCYEVRGNALDQTIKAIKLTHGAGVRLLPLSGQSAGGGVFQNQTTADDCIVGLHIIAVPEPKIRFADTIDIKQINLDEIVIDKNNNFIYTGAAITLQQLNQALIQEIGLQYMVLGADLTSFSYAQVGATFMTGGMGPQRCYFSDSVVEIALHDGEKIKAIQAAEQLASYAGTYGWTGVVSAVKCRYYQVPFEQFSFSIPVKNTADRIAFLLNHLAKFVYLEAADGLKIRSKSGSKSLIMGLEHITVESMQPLLNSTCENAQRQIAVQITDKCHAANADGMIFVYGLSELPIDEVMGELIDDVHASRLTIANVDLDHTYYFSDLNQMRDLREAVSYAARNQKPKGRFSYKGHTDANIWIHPDELESTIKKIWSSYLNYIDAVQQYLASQSSLKGEVLIYGHLNPVGFDPHNRITLAAEDDLLLQAAITQLDKLKNTLVLELADICADSGSVFTGGEKGAGSDYELLSAFEDLNTVPTSLLYKFKKQQQAIKQAATNFSWRALSPYN